MIKVPVWIIVIEGQKGTARCTKESTADELFLNLIEQGKEPFMDKRNVWLPEEYLK